MSATGGAGPWRRKLRVAAAAVAVTNPKKRVFEDGTSRDALATALKNEHDNGELPAWLTYLSSKWHHFSEDLFEGFGLWVGTHPISSMLIGLLILISGLPGTFLGETLVGNKGWFLWMRFEFDPYLTNVNMASQFYTDYTYSTDLHDHYYLGARENVMVFSVKEDGGPLVRRDIMDLPFLVKVADILQGAYLNVKTDRVSPDTLKPYTFSDLCNLNGGRGLPNQLNSTLGRLNQCDSISGGNILAPDEFDRTLIEQLNTRKEGYNDYWQSLQRLSASLTFLMPGTRYDGTGFADDGNTCLITDPTSVEYPCVAADIPNGAGINTAGIFNLNMHGMSRENYAEGYRAWQPSHLLFTANLANAQNLLARSREFAGNETSICQEWEDKLEFYLLHKRPHLDTIDVSFSTTDSFTRAQEKALQSVVPLLMIVAVIMTIYAVVFLGTQTRCHRGYATQAMHISVGASLAGVAGISAVGWLNYFGLVSGNLTACALFLVICVGIDCCFIFTSAMRAVGPGVKSIPHAMAASTAEAAGAITSTTATSVFAFLLSSLFSFDLPIVYSFNIIMAMALSINYCSFLFIFCGMQTLNERRIAAGKPDGPRRPNKYPDWVDVGTKLRKVVIMKYAPLMKNNLPFQLIGASIMALFMVLSIFYIPDLSLGIPAKWNILQTSYLQDLFADAAYMGPAGVNKTNPSLPGTIDMLIENIDMGRGGNDEGNPLGLADPSLTRLHEFLTDTIFKIEERPDVLFVACIPLQFYEYRAWTASPANANLKLPSDMTWQAYVNNGFDPMNPPTTVRQVTLGNQPFGTRSGLYSGEIMPESISCSIATFFPNEDAKASIAQAQFYKFLAQNFTEKMQEDCYPCNPTRITFSNKFQWAIGVGFDEKADASTWQSIYICLVGVFVVLIWVLPIHRAMITCLNIFLVVLSLLTTMAWLEWDYSFVTYAVITCSIGFCVDYTVELMHFSSLGDPTDPLNNKMAEALKAAGYDILHGGTTGFIGVFVIWLADAKFIKIFGALMMCMIMFGVFYALWLLPSVMILCDKFIYQPLTQNKAKRNVKMDAYFQKIVARPQSTKTQA